MKAPKKRIAVLCSGGGSNFQAIIDACKSGRINGDIALMISSSEKAYAIDRAEQNGIPVNVITKKSCGSLESAYEKRHEALVQCAPDLVILAGYLGIILPKTVEAFKGRIINVHPSLLPRHGGKGMHGGNVHRSVLQSGDLESGATVHFVDAGIDSGDIILQKSVPVLPGDDENSLAARVLEVEHEILPEAAALICAEKLPAKGGAKFLP
ncbi:MAG: phosphoribosylglycinamide formyltransferase [Christensenellales bacterium]|jgi:phosphoribosylglycinamide formyltransferase-1